MFGGGGGGGGAEARGLCEGVLAELSPRTVGPAPTGPLGGGGGADHYDHHRGGGGGMRAKESL